MSPPHGREQSRLCPFQIRLCPYQETLRRPEAGPPLEPFERIRVGDDVRPVIRWTRPARATTHGSRESSCANSNHTTDGDTKCREPMLIP